MSISFIFLSIFQLLSINEWSLHFNVLKCHLRLLKSLFSVWTSFLSSVYIFKCLLVSSFWTLYKQFTAEIVKFLIIKPQFCSGGQYFQEAHFPIFPCGQEDGMDQFWPTRCESQVRLSHGASRENSKGQAQLDGSVLWHLPFSFFLLLSVCYQFVE